MLWHTPMTDDAELLRRYAEEDDEQALAAWVRANLCLVYAAALRRLGGDAHGAADVAQQVFVAATRDAARLARHPSVTGWLYAATRNAVLNLMRDEQRRKQRERAAEELARADQVDGTAEWARLKPVLDAAMDELAGADREAVLLRFFEGRAFCRGGAAAAGFGQRRADARRACAGKTARAAGAPRRDLGRRGARTRAGAAGGRGDRVRARGTGGQRDERGTCRSRDGGCRWLADGIYDHDQGNHHRGRSAGAGRIAGHGELAEQRGAHRGGEPRGGENGNRGARSATRDDGARGRGGRARGRGMGGKNVRGRSCAGKGCGGCAHRSGTAEERSEMGSGGGGNGPDGTPSRAAARGVGAGRCDYEFYLWAAFPRTRPE